MDINFVDKSEPNIKIGELHCGDIFYLNNQYYIVTYCSMRNHVKGYSLSLLNGENTWHGTYSSLNQVLYNLDPTDLILGKTYFPADKVRLTIQYDPTLKRADDQN